MCDLPQHPWRHSRLLVRNAGADGNPPRPIRPSVLEKSNAAGDGRGAGGLGHFAGDTEIPVSHRSSGGWRDHLSRRPGTSSWRGRWPANNSVMSRSSWRTCNSIPPLILPDNSRHPLQVRLEIVSAEGDYRICSRPVDGDGAGEIPWTKHSSGRINTAARSLREIGRFAGRVCGPSFGDGDMLSASSDSTRLCAHRGLDYGADSAAFSSSGIAVMKRWLASGFRTI